MFYFIIYRKIRTKKIYYLNRISCIWFRLNPLNISIVWFTSAVGFSLSAADNSHYPRTQSFQNSHGQIISILNLQTLSSTSNSIYVQSPLAFYINLVTRSELAIVPFQAMKSTDFLFVWPKYLLVNLCWKVKLMHGI